MQVRSVCASFGGLFRLKCVALYGGDGQAKTQQVEDLQGRIHFVCATPGRLLEMLAIRALNLRRVTYMVLDEADHMLQLGFEAQLQMLCGQVGAVVRPSAAPCC
jgi:ATP-dependent RNA helicase DDX5/DBP2